MSESPPSSLASDQVGESPIVDLTGKIMVVIIIILFMVVVVALGVHLYAKVFWWRRSSQSQSRSVTALGARNGLDPSILKSLPVTIFQPQDSLKDGLECSVCLSELVEGEKLRLLPKCNHGFHVDCIDMWFQSHATCPICRTIVVASQSEDLESQSFPTNVLIWGNETQITTTTTSTSSTATSLEESPSNNTTKTTSRHDGMLVIDIPGHGEEETPSSSSSPVIRRLRSLRRLLSNNRLNPWSPTSTETKAEGHS